MSRRRGLTASEISAELEPLNNIDAFDSEVSDFSERDSSESEYEGGFETSLNDSDDEEYTPEARGNDVSRAPARNSARALGRKRRRPNQGGGDMQTGTDAPVQQEYDDSAGDQASQEEDNDSGRSLTVAPSQFSTGTVVQSPDGLKWTVMAPTVGHAGRQPQHNVFRDKEGPTPHAKRYIDSASAASSWGLLVSDKILEHIQKCTEAEAKRVIGDDNWSVSLDELEAFIGVLYIRGVCGMRNLDLDSLWSKDYGLNLVKAAMSRNRFKEIMRFLRFDSKSNRSERLKTDKFAHISEVWYNFIHNCQACYIPGPYLSVDEQLFPSKARCRFTQYIASKPDKFGQKFWMIVDKDTKYMLNAFPYLGKEDSRPDNVRLSDYVVEKLAQPYLKKGRNVTCDNFFTSVILAENLLAKSTSLVGTINKVRREIPGPLKKAKLKTHDTVLLKSNNVTLTVCQGKPKKNVILLSTLHPCVKIGSDQKKKPETVSFYNDIVDQMARKYSVKASSRRWPVHTFYNLLDLAGINAWILYRKCTLDKITRRDYLVRLAEELTKKQRNAMSCGSFPADAPEPESSRRRCQIRENCNTDGKSVNKCAICKQVVCKKCVKNVAYVCSVCVTPE